MEMKDEQCKGQIPSGVLWGEQIKTDDYAHRYGLGESREDRAISGDEPVGDNRENVTRIDAYRSKGIRPTTHGGTLRCLIDEVDYQRKSIKKRIQRHKDDIAELQEEYDRQILRRNTLCELLENWQRNVEQITESGG